MDTVLLWLGLLKNHRLGDILCCFQTRYYIIDAIVPGMTPYYRKFCPPLSMGFHLSQFTTY